MSEDGKAFHEIMARDLIEAKIHDMRTRADLLMLDGKALIAKADTLRYEALCMDVDLDKYKRAHPKEFPDD